jgi:hypothetical protein
MIRIIYVLGWILKEVFVETTACALGGLIWQLEKRIAELRGWGMIEGS